MIVHREIIDKHPNRTEMMFQTPTEESRDTSFPTAGFKSFYPTQIYRIFTKIAYTMKSPSPYSPLVLQYIKINIILWETKTTIFENVHNFQNFKLNVSLGMVGCSGAASLNTLSLLRPVDFLFFVVTINGL